MFIAFSGLGSNIAVDTNDMIPAAQSKAITSELVK